MIRVLLVDDSPIVLHILQRLLSRSPEIEVVGTAADGKKALDLLPALKPDVICTDLHMPVMSGLDFTRAVMDSYPCPILVVSVSVEPGSPNIFRLLEAGALDILPKPSDILNGDMDELANELSSKIRILAGVRVFRRRNDVSVAELSKPALKLAVMPRPQTPLRMVVIGASPAARKPYAKFWLTACHFPAACRVHSAYWQQLSFRYGDVVGRGLPVAGA